MSTVDTDTTFRLSTSVPSVFNKLKTLYSAFCNFQTDFNLLDIDNKSGHLNEALIDLLMEIQENQNHQFQSDQLNNFTNFSNCFLKSILLDNNIIKLGK